MIKKTIGIAILLLTVVIVIGPAIRLASPVQIQINGSHVCALATSNHPNFTALLSTTSKHQLVVP